MKYPEQLQSGEIVTYQQEIKYCDYPGAELTSEKKENPTNEVHITFEDKDLSGVEKKFISWNTEQDGSGNADLGEDSGYL